MGVTHVVLRQVDGTEILRRIEKHGVTYLCAAPAVVTAALDGAKTWEGEIPGRDRVRIIVAGAPPPTRTIERVRDELGWEFIQIYGLTETLPLLTMSRMRAEWDDLDPHEQAVNLSRAGAPAIGVRMKVDDRRRGAGPVQSQPRGLLGQSRGNAGRRPAVWFHTGDGGTFERRLHLDRRPQEGRHHLRR